MFVATLIKLLRDQESDIIIINFWRREFEGYGRCRGWKLQNRVTIAHFLFTYSDTFALVYIILPQCTASQTD